MNDIKIEIEAMPPFYKNGYLITNESLSECIYLDPGDEVDLILELIRTRGIDLIAVVNTHAHIDHICGISSVHQVWDVPIYLHPKDLLLYESLPEQGRMFGLEYDSAPPVDEELKDDQELILAGLSIRVHFTPGHSPGHVCLEIGQHLFCGDTIFQGSIGRTDLPGGSHETLMRSIRDRILPLGDSKILYPGHGPKTTIGHERMTNPFLLQND
jgi:glyoxylase-like metal-dependent hydrolase (beta-lactamase superfamily II)